MAPASSTASSSATARHTSSPTPTAITTVVSVTPSHSILTTTITSGGSESLPTVGATVQPNSSNVPIAAIAGGTAAGVVLALVLVVGWTWWGRCIKRRKAKERKEAVCPLCSCDADSGCSFPSARLPGGPREHAQERIVSFGSRESIQTCVHHARAPLAEGAVCTSRRASFKPVDAEGHLREAR